MKVWIANGHVAIDADGWPGYFRDYGAIIAEKEYSQSYQTENYAGSWMVLK